MLKNTLVPALAAGPTTPDVPVAASLCPESVLRARPLLEIDAVARRLSFSPGFVRRLIRSKQLPAIRVSNRLRVEPRDLQAFIDRLRQPAEETA